MRPLRKKFNKHCRDNDPKLVAWREAVFKRDKYTCQICGKRGNLNAHHIFSYSDNPHLRYVLDNGVTLCGDTFIRKIINGRIYWTKKARGCHTRLHEAFGKGQNTLDQWLQFKATYGRKNKN